MGKYKIIVYAICKNEEQFVDRWMDSMKEADQVVVTDTGSTDGTVDKLKARGAVVYVREVKPWRFDVARNLSLDNVPEDADICVCTDLDEIFAEGWREKLENAWMPGVHMGKYLYNWSMKPDNTPDVQFAYFKVHSRKDYRWVCPVHECLQYTGKVPESIIFIHGMVLSHYPDPTKSRGSYLPLLEMAVKENPKDARMTYYLGREYMYKSMWDKCIETLNRHLNMPNAQWKEERSASMRWIAVSHYHLKQVREAYSWYFKAIAEAPHMREPYVEFGRMAYELKDWLTLFYMMESALKIKEKPLGYVNMGYAWDQTPDDLCAIACYRLEMYDKALVHAKAAVAMCPGDPRLVKNVELISEKVKG